MFVVAGGDGFGWKVCTMREKINVRLCLLPFADVRAVG